MKNSDPILTVLQEIRDNQHLQIKKYDEHLVQSEQKYSSYLEKQKKAYADLQKNVFLLLVVFLALAAFSLFQL
jgi:hypothetical protein